MSQIIHVRLNAVESEALAYCCKSEDGNRNPSELVRLLLMREWRRRTTGRSVVQDKDISSEWRQGRPRRKL